MPSLPIHNGTLEVTKSDLAYALLQTIDGLDLVRSHLLAEIVYRPRGGILQLESFRSNYPMQPKSASPTWLVSAMNIFACGLRSIATIHHSSLITFFPPSLERVLSQPGFRFHTSFDAGSITSRLIESVQKFRRVAAKSLAQEAIPPGKEYIQMVEQGVIAAQYLESWQLEDEDSVLIAPAYTYLMSNYPVTAQFWLDIASRSWSERLSQPLTHPYVLSRNWPRDKVWTDTDEIETSQDALYRLVTGLTPPMSSESIPRFN